MNKKEFISIADELPENFEVEEAIMKLAEKLPAHKAYTEEEILARGDEAVEKYKQGKFTTMEHLKKEMKSW